MYDIDPIDPSIHVDGFNRQGYMFIDMEKAKSYSDLVESFGTTKQSLLYSTWPRSQYYPKLRRAFNACMGIHMFGACMG
jgi:hypothetical protein